MKNQWTVYILAAFVLQTCAQVLPASAETAREKAHDKQHVANRESDKAAIARADARADERHGHSFMAHVHAHHARHEQEKAYKHSQEAKVYRSIARHG